MGFHATSDVQAENRYYPVFRTEESENRLISIESLPAVPDQAKVRLEFTYDYMGRRVRKTVLSGHNGSAYQQTNEVTFVYDGWNLIAALDEDLVAGTTSSNFYLWGLDLSGSLQGAGGVGGLLATTQDGAHYFVCLDGNGNVMALIDATDGTVAGEYEYGPFGEPLKALGDAAEENAVRFSSKYTDTESGLLYYGYRYLDPSTGRWLSRDPLGEKGGAHLYAFVGNSPVHGVDVLGLQGAWIPRGFERPDIFTQLREDRAREESARQSWFRRAVRIGNIPPGLPQELLRRYIWETGGTLRLSASRFLAEVKPVGSIKDPDRYGISLPKKLTQDLAAKCKSGHTVRFDGSYRFACFHSAHSTGGLGRFIMSAQVRVCCTGKDTWVLRGSAQLEPELFDFDWKLLDVIREQFRKLWHGGEDLHGRHTRAFFGSMIPGKPFRVEAEAVGVYQSSRRSNAVFRRQD